MPRPDAVQRLAAAIHLPERAVLPAERLAHGGQHPRRRLGERGRFAEGPRDFAHDGAASASGLFIRFAATANREALHYCDSIRRVVGPFGESREAQHDNHDSRPAACWSSTTTVPFATPSRRCFRTPDTSTDQAGDGPEALDKLRQQPVDLMLLDIGLPGMSGLDVLAQAARSPNRRPAW